MKRLRDRIHWLGWAAFVWVTASVLIAELEVSQRYLWDTTAELVGYPFGWPIAMFRTGLGPHGVWAILIDLLSCVAVVAGTAIVAFWFGRKSRQLRFRLSTLMGFVVVIAVLANLWRVNEASHTKARFSSESRSQLMLDSMHQWPIRYAEPPLVRPIRPAVRAGVVFGFGCAIYVVVSSAANLIEQSLRHDGA